MKGLGWITPWIALGAAFVLAGCPGLDEGGDGGTGDAGAADGGGNQTCYPYVLVLDRESGGGNGVDLDSVAVYAPGMTLVGFADELHEVTLGPGQDVTCQDGNSALGAADDTAVCLGGSDGAIVLSFAARTCIEQGDTIEVTELGLEGEPYDVMVGVTPGLSDPNWVLCASAATGLAQCVVPVLPQL